MSKDRMITPASIDAACRAFEAEQRDEPDEGLRNEVAEVFAILIEAN